MLTWKRPEQTGMLFRGANPCGAASAIFALLLISQHAQASYIGTHLAELLILSDLVVVGEIKTISETSFALSVQAAAKGQWSAPTIKVRKFEDWTCARRYSPYKQGQQAVFFLQRFDFKGKRGWRTIGAANEGEWPVSNGVATYLDSQFGREVRAVWPETWLRILDAKVAWMASQGWAEPIAGPLSDSWAKWRQEHSNATTPPEPDKYQIDALLAAVREYPDCFVASVAIDNHPTVREISATCQGAAMQKFRERSIAHAAFADGLLAHKDTLERRFRNR